MALYEAQFFVDNCTSLIDMTIEEGMRGESIDKVVRTITQLRLVMAGHLYEPSKSEAKQAQTKRELDLMYCKERLDDAIRQCKEESEHKRSENKLALRELEVACSLRPPPRKEAYWGVLDTYARAQIAAQQPSPSSSTSSSPSSSPFATSVSNYDGQKDSKGAVTIESSPADKGDSQDTDSDSASMMSARSNFSSDNAVVDASETAHRRSRNPLKRLFKTRR